MARADAALLSLAESVADGSPIDWAAAERAASPAEQAIVRQLRILAELAVLHRSLPAPDAPRGGAAEASTMPAIGAWAHLALVELLGRGTFGEVYRAWDRHLERDVALKLLHGTPGTQEDPSLSRDTADPTADPHVAAILREARLLARVRHANVVHVYGVDVHGGRVGLWMELIRGETLERLLARSGPLNAREAALIGIDLCRALAAIHGAGLIHRDVKAQNVMRETGGRIVLMDLGTGRPSGPRIVPDLAGTPLYLAPEIFTGTPASERTDVYSLGVLLYHLVTGSFPVAAPSLAELEQRHAAGTRTRLRDARADLPTAFVSVVDRALAGQEQRYASAGELEAALIGTLEDTRPIAVPETPAPSGRPPWLLRWRAAMATAVVAATVALAGLAWPTVRDLWRTPSSIESIAVLPIVNVSGNPAQEYFADGMTDELIMTLGRIRGINVISRTSVMQFKRSKTPLPQIARALGVDAVLEGSVLLMPGGDTSGAGRRVRINARLMYASTEAQLWERTFERVVDDVLALQSEVARAVTDGIDSRLTAQVRQFQVSGTVNPRSYDAYLRGRYLVNKRTPEDLRNAVDQFQAAVDADPTSALAWAGLADGYFLLTSYDEEDPREAWPRARAAAARALQLEELSEARAVCAVFELLYQRDLPAAEREFQRALALNPNYAIAHAWYGLYLNEVGRFDEALTEMKRAQELDPLSLVTEVNVARSFYFSRQYGQAEELLGQLARREPDYWIGHAILGQIYIAQNRWDDAISALVRARELSPAILSNLGVLGDVLGRAGRRAEALEILDELNELSRRRYVSAIYPAMVYMGLGDNRRALDFLERADVERSDWIMQINVDPQFDPLRSEPRFQALLLRTGQTPRLPLP